MLYSVPSAIVLRRWASREVEPKRRLLLRNAGPTALHFRLVLPQSDAFSLSGALLAAASAGGSSVGALAAGGTATLSVELARDRAPRQLVDELQVSTREGVLHIPLIALADADTISGTISGGGEFVERWSGPEGDEVWDLAQVGPTSEPVADAGAGARSSRGSVPVRRDVGEGSIRRDFGEESTRRDLGEGSIRRGSTEGSIRRDSAEGSVPRDSAEGSVPRDAAEGSVWGVATCSARQWPPESLTPAECTGEAELAHYIDLMQQQWTQLQQGRRRKEGEDEQQQASIHLPRAPYACIPPVTHPYPTTCIHPLRVPHSPPYPSPPRLPPPSHSLHTPSPPPTPPRQHQHHHQQEQNEQEQNEQQPRNAPDQSISKAQENSTTCSSPAEATRPQPPPTSDGAGAPGAAADVREALCKGTYFVIGGVVCDSRGRELGAEVDVLGRPEFQAVPAPRSNRLACSC